MYLSHLDLSHTQRQGSPASINGNIGMKLVVFTQEFMMWTRCFLELANHRPNLLHPLRPLHLEFINPGIMSLAAMLETSSLNGTLYVHVNSPNARWFANTGKFTSCSLKEAAPTGVIVSLKLRNDRPVFWEATVKPMRLPRKSMRPVKPREEYKPW